MSRIPSHDFSRYIDLGLTYIPDEYDNWDNLLAHDTMLPFRLRTFARSEDGRTALFFACRCGHTAMCNYLLDRVRDALAPHPPHPPHLPHVCTRA